MACRILIATPGSVGSLPIFFGNPFRSFRACIGRLRVGFFKACIGPKRKFLNLKNS